MSKKAILWSSDEDVNSAKKLRRQLARAIAVNATVEHASIEDTPMFCAIADYVNEADEGFLLAELAPGHLAVLDADDEPVCHVFQRVSHENDGRPVTRTAERMLADIVQFVDAYFTVTFARSGYVNAAPRQSGAVRFVKRLRAVYEAPGFRPYGVHACVAGMAH